MAGMYFHHASSFTVLDHLNAKTRNHLKGYEDYFHTGSIFPDWGYTDDYLNNLVPTLNVIKKISNIIDIPVLPKELSNPQTVTQYDRDAGEDSHWTWFFLSGVLYLKSQSKHWSDWSETNKQLAAFMLGQMVHGSGDAEWVKIIPGGGANSFEIKSDFDLVLTGKGYQLPTNTVENGAILKVYEKLIEVADTPYNLADVNALSEARLTQKAYLTFMHSLQNVISSNIATEIAASITAKANFPKAGSYLKRIAPLIAPKLDLLGGILYENNIPEGFLDGKSLEQIIKDSYSSRKDPILEN